MKRLIIAFSGMLLAVLLAPAANAALVLDTGTPTSMTMPMTLDSNDFYAAEFSLATTSSINSVSAYLLSGLSQAGDTFTISIYAGSSIGRYSVADYSTQGTYGADGWNLTSTSSLGWTESAGNYWVALEVGTSDSAKGLYLPTQLSGGTAPAQAFAFNSGGGYMTSGAMPFGIQVDASAVPLPGAVWLLGSGVLGLGAVARRRRVAVRRCA